MEIRNIAIIAHVDHGKTTLVDFMLRQSGTFRENQDVATRVMDSGDLEKEKGITISAKNTAIQYGDTKINIVDTPGHADFGGEVERVLKMVNGVILLVDAAEGPLPQTKFVLRKSLALGYKPIVLINKIDRGDARPAQVLDEIFDLFVGLDAHEDQLDFPHLYAIAKQGIIRFDADGEDHNLDPLFDLIVKHVPPPSQEIDKPFRMLVSNIEWNDYVGRIAVGRVQEGAANVGDEVFLLNSQSEIKTKAKVTKLFTFSGLQRAPADRVEAGDVVALAGYEEVFIGDTLVSPENKVAIEYADVDQPTLSMFFRVNDSPLAGTEGQFVTANLLKDRLFKEARNNISIRVEPTDSADAYKVSGRGELQLAILIESMRREGFEFAVSKPEVLLKIEDGVTMEPIEEVVVDVPEEFSSKVIDNLQQRKGVIQSMHSEGESQRVVFMVPSRGIIGFRGELLTETKGTAIMHQQFDHYAPIGGHIPGRKRGALVSMENGNVTAYALEGVQDRGLFFVEAGDISYVGMVVGLNNRADDLVVNVAKKKALTNHRASQTADSVKVGKARKMSLEESLEFLEKDELLEVTPKSLRLRKIYLDHNDRKRNKKKA
jgi:GTP-binding protein